MTKEILSRANEISKEMEDLKIKIEVYKTRTERFEYYIDFVKNKEPYKWAGKDIPKVKISMGLDPHSPSVDDKFDIFEENKEQFISFLENCLISCRTKIESYNKEIKKLEKEFEGL